MKFYMRYIDKLRNIVKISMVINTELKYQFLKNTKRFQVENIYQLFEAKRYLSNSVYYSLILNSVIYGGLSLIFGETAFRDVSEMRNLLVSIYGLILILGIMADSQFFRGIWDMNLIGPLKPLPIRIDTEVVPVATFLYNESFLFAISLPAALLLSTGFHNMMVFIILFLYTIFFIYLARLISLLLGILWSKYNTNKITKRLYFSQIMQLLFILIFIFFIQIATNPSIFEKINFPSFLFLFFPFSQNLLLHNQVSSLFLFAFEFIPIYGIYSFIIRKSFSEKFETYLEISRNIDNKKSKLKNIRSHSQIAALIMKDLKSLARKRGALIIIILPAIFIFPFILDMTNTTGASQIISSIIPYFSSIFLISFIELISLEGKGAWHLSYLPVTRSAFFFSKFIEVIFLSSIYYFVLFIITLFAKSYDFFSFLINFPFYIILISTILFAGGGYIIKSIPDGVSVISMDALGGRAFFIKIMAISFPLIIFNAFIFGIGEKIMRFFSYALLNSYIFTIIIDGAIILISYYIFIKKHANF